MDENCHVDPIQKTVTAEDRKITTTILLAVSGMGCPNCLPASATVRSG